MSSVSRNGHVSQSIPSRTSGPRVPLYASPSVRHAADAVAVLLRDYDYTPHARDRVVLWIRAHGTPTGCPELDREDEADAEMVFVAELEEVPFDSEAWDRDTGVLFDAAMLADGTHPWPIPAVGHDDREAFAEAMDAYDRAHPWPTGPGPLEYPCEDEALYGYE
jgi:hypothetical protein